MFSHVNQLLCSWRDLLCGSFVPSPTKSPPQSQAHCHADTKIRSFGEHVTSSERTPQNSSKSMITNELSQTSQMHISFLSQISDVSDGFLYNCYLNLISLKPYALSQRNFQFFLFLLLLLKKGRGWKTIQTHLEEGKIYNKQYNKDFLPIQTIKRSYWKVH